MKGRAKIAALGLVGRSMFFNVPRFHSGGETVHATGFHVILILESGHKFEIMTAYLEIISRIYIQVEMIALDIVILHIAFAVSYKCISIIVVRICHKSDLILSEDLLLLFKK